jgi:SAM-dependent methyltransferase
MPIISNDTSGYYDAIAEYYPYFYRDWETQLQREGLGLRSIFRTRGVVTVLDASCRGGAQSIPLAQLGYVVSAADASAGMLRTLQENARALGVLDRIVFARAELSILPQVFPGPFDAVVSKGNALAHLLLDREIQQAVRNFYALLRPGGTLVVGMRDFGPFMEARPRFIPGFVHDVDDTGTELITFDLWDWEDGPPVIATQNLFIVKGRGENYSVIKRRVQFRPLSVDEVKVVLLETGFVDVLDQPDRAERVLIARKPVTA